MKSNELRIGNWVMEYDHKASGNHVCLDGFMLIDIIYSGFRPEPVKLTEEWLLKFGFEKSSYGWSKSPLTFCKDGDFCIGKHVQYNKPEYVH